MIPAKNKVKEPKAAVVPKVEPLKLRSDIFGWIDEKTPNSGYRPSLGSPCIVCSKPLRAPVVTQYVSSPIDSKKYFYCAHELCWNSIGKIEKSLYEKCLKDLLNKGAI